MNIVAIGLGCGFGAYAAYHLSVSALSDVLGLKTLRHGTGPRNYLLIQKNGALPHLGGKSPGEATLLNYTSKHTENKFFVWDDDFNQDGRVGHDSKFVRWLIKCKPLHPIVKRLGAKYYSIQGGIASATIPNLPGVVRIPLQLIGGIGGFLTPVLDFHTTPEKFEKKFEVDGNMVPVARHTAKRLKSWKYIGLTGVLYQGVNRKIFARIKNDPSRFVKGLAKTALLAVLILSIMGVISTYGHVSSPIDIYTLIGKALARKALILPLSAGCGIALPFVSLTAT